MEAEQPTYVAHTQSHKYTAARPWKQLGQSAFLAQTCTRSYTHMHAHHVHMQECKQSITLPQRLHAYTNNTHGYTYEHCVLTDRHD